jgi:hypothetical protein
MLSSFATFEGENRAVILPRRDGVGRLLAAGEVGVIERFQRSGSNFIRPILTF